ncbi:hypothetical protein KIN20_033640 [Parelaphostrongylus tenuis]|uniref:Uncharacterized protein n=1 Tax=Parelaphostrongylus tenuis TaxID=148309 RepID=A0AAD5RAN7_PARTN|nr:hypothetical protein KIN20_033640 [Parelaphostrongylus tenuis]
MIDANYITILTLLVPGAFYTQFCRGHPLEISTKRKRSSKTRQIGRFPVVPPDLDDDWSERCPEKTSKEDLLDLARKIVNSNG